MRDVRIVLAPLAVRFPAGAFKGPEPALDTGQSLRMKQGPGAVTKDDSAPAPATGRHLIQEVPCRALPEPNNGQVGLAPFFLQQTSASLMLHENVSRFWRRRLVSRSVSARQTLTVG